MDDQDPLNWPSARAGTPDLPDEQVGTDGYGEGQAAGLEVLLQGRSESHGDQHGRHAAERQQR